MPKKFPNKNYKNVIEYYNDYSKSLNETLVLIKSNQIKNVLSLLNKSIQNRKNIFICGNGGSSSVSNHFLCDFQKGLLLDKKLRLRTYSLSSNTDLITAISNDLNYNKIFSLQLDSLADQNDLLIIFSVSGKSGNIIEAAKSAEEAIFKIPATIPPVTFADIVKSFLAVNLRLDPTILISGPSIKMFLLACI